MQSFDLTDEQRHVLVEADRFAREQLAPFSRRMDDEEWWPDEVFPLLGKHGYLGITVPPELGGSGLDLFTAGLVALAIGRWNPSIGLSWGAHENLCLNNLLRNGTADQHARYLPGLCDGSRVGALALTEPEAGSDALGGMRTTARREGDVYLLNGTKLYITNGPIADVVLVYAKTAPELGPHGISAFIVERGFAGFRVGQKLTKMGFRGSPTGELIFDDCEVPVANLVGPENLGVAVVMSGLDLERAFLALASVGLAERCLELSLDYARQRRQFGRPIGSFQMIQAKLADMYVAIESMRSLCFRTLSAANDLEVGGGGRGEIHKLSAAALLYAGEAASRVAADAVQIHGGSGFIWETEVNRLYRASKLAEIGAGTSEVRRLIIAGELLGSL